MDLLRFLIVGLVAGWVLGKIRRGRGYGFFGNLLIGALGSLIGWFLAGFLKMQASNILEQIAMAVAGAVVFFLILGLLKPKKGKKSSEDDVECCAP
jgi:uncharacterized membrane protein YeaQ/YmgE (transglycosylase-associated protein family)